MALFLRNSDSHVCVQYGATLRRLGLGGARGLCEEALRRLLLACRHLEHLDLYHSSGLTDATLKALVAACPSLLSLVRACVCVPVCVCEYVVQVCV